MVFFVVSIHSFDRAEGHAILLTVHPHTPPPPPPGQPAGPNPPNPHPEQAQKEVSRWISAVAAAVENCLWNLAIREALPEDVICTGMRDEIGQLKFKSHHSSTGGDHGRRYRFGDC